VKAPHFVYFGIPTWQFHSSSAHTKSGKATLPTSGTSNNCGHLCMGVAVAVAVVWVGCGRVGIGIDSCLYLVGEGLLDVQ